jgi:hypothetical protein
MSCRTWAAIKPVVSMAGGLSGLPQSSADVQLRHDEFWAVKDVSFE